MLPVKWKILYVVTFVPLWAAMMISLLLRGLFCRLQPGLSRPAATERRLLILAYLNEDNASARHRVYKYLPYLKAAGLQCTVSPPTGPAAYRRLYCSWRPWGQYRYFLRMFLGRFRAIWSACGYDVVLIQRSLLSEFFYDPPGLIFALRFLNPVVVYDFDDAVFMLPPHSVRGKSRALNRIASLRFRAYVATSRVAIASTPYLGACARQYCRDVVVIPTPVDVENYPLRQHEEASPVTIGWTGGGGNLGFLKAIEAPLAALARRYCIRLCVVSARPIRVQGVETEFVPWSREIESTNVARFDVGVMPLVDNAYTRGKCGFKLMQYMASGVPAVASPVGVNTEIVRHGETGFLAATEEEWERYLEALIVSVDLRTRMGAEGRRVAERAFAYSVWAPRLVDILRGVGR